jgi:hypothetical protein
MINKMNNMAKDFTVTLHTDQTPKEVFNAIRNVRAWWSGFYEEEIIGKTEKLNDEFTFRAGNGAHNTTQRLIEVIPNKKVVWLITHSELSFLEKKDEWIGTKIIFEISKEGAKTKLQFTHQGLNSEIECYHTCTSAWNLYLQKKLLPIIAPKKLVSL